MTEEQKRRQAESGRRYRETHREQRRALYEKYQASKRDPAREERLRTYNQSCTGYTLDLRLRKLLRTITQRCTDPRADSWKNYGAKGIQNFLTLCEIKTLWFRDGAYNMVRPTIDREKSTDHYTFATCSFIEHADNLRKAVKLRDSRRQHNTTMRHP